MPEAYVQNSMVLGKWFELIRPNSIITERSMDQDKRGASSTILIGHGITIDLDPIYISSDRPPGRKIRHQESSSTGPSMVPSRTTLGSSRVLAALRPLRVNNGPPGMLRVVRFCIVNHRGRCETSQTDLRAAHARLSTKNWKDCGKCLLSAIFFVRPPWRPSLHRRRSLSPRTHRPAPTAQVSSRQKILPRQGLSTACLS
jgi:hypothetical protein